ncbi:hypothetical protein BH93_13435 [Rhodococcoides fascians A25f]|uniref:hypothetical protein n=1 Tax=Rhodococcoides fascians TaxID=1828 RepID=UPI00056CAE41|nr:hypothetical protein [Rhodococcus fascians]QII06240.1 hypothetical protein BH93_13435 [Rhodococcus fascians A25f]
MAGTRKRRHATIAAVTVVGIIAGVWWMTAATYTRTATIAITATYPGEDTVDPNTPVSTYRGTGLDLTGYDPLMPVGERLAHQRGGSAADYSDTLSIAPTVDGAAGLSVTAQAGTAGEAAEVANEAAAIVVELFNAVPTVSADVAFHADITEPAR